MRAGVMGRAHAGAVAYAVTVLLCSGCFESRVVDPADDAGPRVDPASLREARETLQSIADERCRHGVDCAPLYEDGWGLGYREGILCHPVYQHIDELVAAIARGDAILDRAAVAECLAHLASFEGCFERLVYDPSPPCDQMLAGTLPPGSPCAADDDWCDPSGYCDPCTTVCTRRWLLGERCEGRGLCADGLRCDDGACRPIDIDNSRALGESCDLDRECPVGALCALGACRALPSATGLGEPCFAGRWCSDGQWCLWESGATSCEAPRSAGGRCAGEGSCETGLVCTRRNCRPRSGPGEPCERPDECRPDAPYCVAGTCRVDPDGMACQVAHALFLEAFPTGCPDGYGCVGDDPSVVGECRRVVALGAACEDHALCPASSRCHEGICRAVSDPGDPCDAERICPELFACPAGRCIPMPVVGERCTDDLPCSRGACREGVCALLALGEPCPEDDWLCDRAWCIDGVCTAVRVAAPGEPCSGEGVICGPTARCIDHEVCVDECAADL